MTYTRVQPNNRGLAITVGPFPWRLGTQFGLFGIGVIIIGVDPSDIDSSTGFSWEVLMSTSSELARHVQGCYV
ncbi:MAG: hypothetical protein IH953_09805 [Chloroflexi bacterium]|nr:hypothetical protein [Chloroflexota bacterium]